MTIYRGDPVATLCRGRRFYAIRYIVGWRHWGVVKVGSTFGVRRAYDYSVTGGETLLVDYYESLHGALNAERTLWWSLRERYPVAHEDVARKLARRGGAMECLVIPDCDWGESLWHR